MPTEPTSPLVEAMNSGIETAGQAAGQFITDLPLWLSKLLLAALAALVGAMAVRLGRRIIKKLVRSRKAGDARAMGQRETLRSLVCSVFDYTMYFIIATIVLGIFGVNVTSMIAVAGVGGVAIGFGAQTLVKDVISGIFLWAEGNMSVGDVVDINGLSGEVESIALRTTAIRNYSGNLFVIPNGDIRTVTNMSRSFKRAIVDVRVPYEEKLERILSILEDEMGKAFARIEGLSETPQVLGVLAYETDAIIVRLAVLCPAKENWRIERELRRLVKDRFDEEGIQMPHVQKIAIK